MVRRVVYNDQNLFRSIKNNLYMINTRVQYPKNDKKFSLNYLIITLYKEPKVKSMVLIVV